MTTLRLNNQKFQVPTEGEEALLAGLQANETLTKLNLDIRDATTRERVEKRLAENIDRVRKKRHESNRDSTPVVLVRSSSRISIVLFVFVSTLRHPFFLLIAPRIDTASEKDHERRDGQL